MVFTGASQRQIWGYSTLFWDWMAFSSTWIVPEGIMRNIFWIVNFVVLGVLFGERALMNVVPLFTAMFQAKKGN